MDTKMMVHDHATLISKCDAIEQLCAEPHEIRDFARLFEHLDGFFNQLQVHLAYEDRCLYPFLMTSKDSFVKESAVMFYYKLGSLASKIEAFAATWNINAAQAESLVFVSDLFELTSDIRGRIKQEDQLLFPLVEKI